MNMIVLVLFAFAAGVAGEQDAIVMDDACLAGQGGEECALALRQLRGEQHLQEVARHSGLPSAPTLPPLDDIPVNDSGSLPPLDEPPADSSSPPEEDEDDTQTASAPTDAPADAATPSEEEEYSGGFCCYSGASAKNTCGTCYPTAKAGEGTFCNSKDNCGGCGGTWCTAQCVFSGADPSNICGTAYDTAIASAGGFCSKTASGCKSCKGTWCWTGAKGGAGSTNASTPATHASSGTPAPSWADDGPTEPPSTGTLPPLDTIPDGGFEAPTPPAAPADTATPPSEDEDDSNAPPSSPTLPPLE